MRISDWSSDVCSSDLQRGNPPEARIGHPCTEQPDPAHRKCAEHEWSGSGSEVPASQARGLREGVHPARGVAEAEPADRCGNCKARKSVVLGKRLSVRLKLRGGGIVKKKKNKINNQKKT